MGNAGTADAICICSVAIHHAHIKQVGYLYRIACCLYLLSTFSLHCSSCIYLLAPLLLLSSAPVPTPGVLWVMLPLEPLPKTISQTMRNPTFRTFWMAQRWRLSPPGQIPTATQLQGGSAHHSSTLLPSLSPSTTREPLTYPVLL